MADEMVRRAQRFVNSYNVEGIPKLAEDGITGYATMYALTRVLQHELGISALSDNFGPGTMSALESRHPVVNATTARAAVVGVAQSALYCKGYDGGDIDGTCNSRVSAAVTRIKDDMGVAGLFPADGIVPKVFKALLTMDAYVVVNGGSGDVRTVQQWMNGRYATRRNFFHLALRRPLLPGRAEESPAGDPVPDRDERRRGQRPLRAGHPGRDQAEPHRGRLVGDMGPAVHRRAHLQPAVGGRLRGVLRLRPRRPCPGVPALRRTAGHGNGDYPTWASLLVSTGDTARPGTAADCVSAVTAAMAASLSAAGYRVVGRYLSNVPNSTLNKRIQPGELSAIAGAGLSAFPIYQTFGGSASYFNYAQGRSDAFAAMERARHYGFRAGTRIYFARPGQHGQAGHPAPLPAPLDCLDSGPEWRCRRSSGTVPPTLLQFHDALLPRPVHPLVFFTRWHAA